MGLSANRPDSWKMFTLVFFNHLGVTVQSVTEIDPIATSTERYFILFIDPTLTFARSERH
jgi:hypothetical protein